MGSADFKSRYYNIYNNSFLHQEQISTRFVRPYLPPCPMRQKCRVGELFTDHEKDTAHLKGVSTSPRFLDICKDLRMHVSFFFGFFVMRRGSGLKQFWSYGN